MKLFLLFLLFISTAYAVEWDCAAKTNTGTFIKSNNCTISGDNHVEVSGTLEIEGSRADMITITAASKHRHFYLNNANANLTLSYIKLIGGDVREAYSYGGSILIYTNGGELNLYSSVVFNNKGDTGGGISAVGASNTNKNAIMNIYNSIIQNNVATPNWGGGIYMYSAVGTIENTTIDNNQANYGGGMYIWDSDVTMKNTNVSNNDAEGGGGLLIQGSSTTVTLRQSSFINNDATNNGDEISTLFSPTISLDNDIFKLDIYDDNNPIWNLNQGNYTGKISNIKHLINMEKINKLEKLLGGCTCSESVLNGCTTVQEDKKAIIAAYKQLNQCGT